MDDLKRREHIADFSKHVPKLLQMQLLNEQSARYVRTQQFDPHITDLLPSIQRFHGSILFVDISGFTILSQTLDVESLKNYINGYFSQIIEIVEKWGGDVIKFAGDALYVVWQTNTGNRANGLGAGGEEEKGGGGLGRSKSMRSMSMMPTFINVEFRQNASDATNKAISCGLEICDVCGNYPVYMEGKNNPGRDGQGMFSSIVTSLTSKIISRNMASESQQPIAHLNVHCGVSVGLMAGLDVGYDNRWEYFIVGEALNDVAKAEGQAEKGDVVISRSAHEFLHPGTNVQFSFEDGENDDTQYNSQKLLSCGCCLLFDDCLRVQSINNSSHPGNAKLVKNKSSTQLRPRKSVVGIDIKRENQKLYETFATEVKAALMVITPLLKKEYATYIMEITKDSSDSETSNEAIIQKVKQLDKLLPTFIHSKVRRHLSNWLEQSLIDHLARHVHDVAREGYTIAVDAHLEPFRVLLESFFTSMQNKNSSKNPFASSGNTDNIENERIKKPVSIHPGSSSAFNHSLQTAKTTVSMNDEDHSELDEMYDSKVTLKDGSKFQGKTFYQSSVDAEMRNVTVMFIKIDSFDMSLLIDTSLMKENKKLAQRYDASYGFLERTENEQMADKMIVDRLQRCLEVLHRSIYSHGGQLRQFIVDDKGTVCIASFGLRGAVNDDNAANAMEAANIIVKDLEKQGLNASIGITTGKVYCGLVGSNLRHEYAIMGPSVNLSARLMGKAHFGSILCDQETKHSDRAHTFKHKGEIVAKGYAQPVSTYSPSFEDSVHLDYNDNSIDDYSGLYAPGDTFIGDGEDSGMLSTRSGAVGNPDVSKRKRTSALRFSIAVDAPQIHSIRSKLIKETTSHERLIGLVESEFVFTDEINGGRGNDGNSVISSSMMEKSGKFTGFRTLHGRAAEIERILYFMFEEGGQDGFSLANYEAQPRLVVVIGSGGAGKTALFSAIGQKLFSAAKTDIGCNVVVLSNRMSQLIASARQNPWRPILIELVRLLKKAYELQSLVDVGPGVSPKHVTRKHRSNMRMLVKQDSIREYTIVIDNLFSQLDSELQPSKVILTDLMGITSPITPEVTGSTVMMNAVQHEKVQQFKSLMVAVINHYTSIVKKALVIMLEDVNTIDKASSDVLKYIWENAKGVHFLLSSSTSSIGMPTNPASPLKANTSTRGSPPPSSQHAASKLGSVRQNSIFSSLENNPRFLQLELQPLTKDASIAIAEDIIGDEFPAPLKKAISSSGGNPLYIVQMASSMIIDGTSPIALAMGSAVAEVNVMSNTNALSEKKTIFPVTQQSIADLNNIANMKRRVEEIICYRLDRLDGFTQMVLKAATVAAANGKSFSVKLIAFMINGNSKMLLKLSASIFPTLLETDMHLLGSDPLTPDAAPAVSDGAHHHNHHPVTNPMRIDLRTRERMVSHILQTLINNGDFIQLKMVGDDSEKGRPATSPMSQAGNEVDGMVLLKGDEEFEFQITTEQSTIYSMIVDEQREYFHGKVSQYYHQRWLTCPDTVDVTLALGDMLNIAYHAEQAALWPLALRAFLQSSVFEYTEGKVKEFMASILECYKIYRCFEQESGTTIAPYVPAEIMAEPELVQRILTQKQLPEEELDRFAKRFEEDLDSVYDVFGLDRESIVFAARVHLYLADFYLSGFYDVSLAEQMLGTALKLMFAVRLCEDFHDHDAVHGSMHFQGDAEEDLIHLPTVVSTSVATAAAGEDTTKGKAPSPTGVAQQSPSQAQQKHPKPLQVSSAPSARSLDVSTVLEDVDVCHFYATFFVLTHTIPTPTLDAKSASNKDHDAKLPGSSSAASVSPQDMTNYVPHDSLQAYFVSSNASASWYGMQVLHHLRLHRFDEAIAAWHNIPPYTSAASLYQKSLHLGMLLGLLATSSLLQALAGIGGAQYDQVIADCIARISRYIDLYDGSMVVFHALTPAIAPMALLGRWRTLITWFKTIGNNARHTHDILGAQNALYKHLYRWLRALYHVYLHLNYGALISTADTDPMNVDTTVVVVPSLTELKHSLDYFSSTGGVLKTRCSGSKALEQFMKMIQPTLAMNIRHVGLLPETLCMQLLFAAFFLDRERILNDAAGLLEFENRFVSLQALFVDYYQSGLLVGGGPPTPCPSLLLESSLFSFAVNQTVLRPILVANAKRLPTLSPTDVQLQESLMPTGETHAVNAMVRQLLTCLGDGAAVSHAQNLKRILTSCLYTPSV